MVVAAAVRLLVETEEAMDSVSSELRRFFPLPLAIVCRELDLCAIEKRETERETERTGQRKSASTWRKINVDERQKFRHFN